MTPKGTLLGVWITLATVGALSACDMGLQGRLDEKRDERFERAKNAVLAIEAARTQALASSLPAADAKTEGKLHPMHEWRKQVATREDDQKTLLALAKEAYPTGGREVGARGTPSEAAAELGASFVKESNSFWGDQSSVSRYVAFLDNYLKSVEAEKAKHPEMTDPPFIDEARFDLAFAHAATYYTINKNFDRDTLLAVLNNTALVEDWEVAFGVPSNSGEGFSDYIMRLCLVAPALKDKCKGYPHEQRALIIDRAYLEWLKQKAAAFNATTETTKVFDTILDQLVVALDETLAKELAVQPDSEQDPLLPSTVAPPTGLSGIDAIFSHAGGVRVQKAAVAAEDERYAVLADSLGARVPAGVAAGIKSTIEEVKETPGNPINWQRAIVHAPSDLTMGAIGEHVRAFPHEYVRTMVFVGRRRVDDSYRMTGIEAALPTPDDMEQPVVYKFNEDADPISCLRLGFLGKPPIGEVDSYFLEIAPTRIRVASTKVDPETQQYIVGDTEDLGKADDLSKLEAWLAEHPGRHRIFLSESFTYEQGMTILSRVVYECKPRTYTLPGQMSEKGAPLAIDVPCGNAEPRQTTVVLGLCR